MNWAYFIILLFAGVVLEMGLFDLLTVAGARPSLVAILAAFIALSAARNAALWGCLLCGLLLDLTSAITFDAGRTAHLIGPNALGYVFAGLLLIQVRSLVMRRQVFATAVMTALFVLAAAVVAVAIAAIRSWYSPELAGFGAFGSLGRRALVAVYTGLLAVPVGWLLLRYVHLWRFPTVAPVRTNWR